MGGCVVEFERSKLMFEMFAINFRRFQTDTLMASKKY